MLNRWLYIGIPTFTSRITFHCWSLTDVQKFQINRLMPSRTTRAGLLEGLFFSLLIDQVPSAFHVKKIRKYEIALPSSIISGYTIFNWSFRLWAVFFQQAEQFALLRVTVGQKPSGVFFSRFRKYVFYHETLWLRQTYKHVTTINNIFLNIGVISKQKHFRNLLESFLRFSLLPLKFRLSEHVKERTNFFIDRTKNISIIFKRFRWLKAYRAFIPWTARRGKVLRSTKTDVEFFFQGYTNWIQNYKKEFEKKKQKKKRRKKRRPNTRFRRRRYGKKRLRLKVRNLSRYKRLIFFSRTFFPCQCIYKSKIGSRFYYSWASVYKIKYLLNEETTYFMRKLYWIFFKLFKKRYKLFLYHTPKSYYFSRRLTFFAFQDDDNE